MTDETFRHEQILSLQSEMKAEQIKYENVMKKYKKAHRIAGGIEIACDFIALSSASSALATGLSGVGLVVAVPLAVIGGINAAVVPAMAVINRKVHSKLRKHMAITELAASSCKSLSRLVSKAIDDEKIENVEYEMACKLVEDYYLQKNELRKKKIDMKNALTDAYKKGEKYMKSKFVAGMKQVDG